MDSDSGEEFDISVSEISDDYSVDSAPAKSIAKSKGKSKSTSVSVKPKATTKPKATGKAAGKTTVTKKKPLKPLENVSDNESAMSVESDHSEDSDASIAKPKPTKTAMPMKSENIDASDIYQKLTPIEHILKRPDSYIGSIETRAEDMWVFNAGTSKLEFRNINYVPGFFKIFDEILVNAADNKINDPNMTAMKVDINLSDPGAPEISVWNNGKGIPIEVHKKEKIWIPSMIFGQLLTSSHYDDNEKRLTGGRNGYGAKLTNIYSTSFTVETADKRSGQKFRQTWRNHMGSEEKAKITPNPKDEEYTKVVFRPDLERFGMTRIDQDTEALMIKRVYDIAGTVDGITVTLNKERIKIKNFKSYVEMYLKAASEAAVEGSGAAPIKPTIIHEQTDRWEYVFAISESGAFQQVSFANSICTIKGGTHVNLITDQICKKLLVNIEKKNKAAKVKNNQIKNHMWIFVKALIENPTFDSQTKDTLMSVASKFGSKPVVSDEFVKKVAKSDIITRVLDWAKFKSEQILAKTDGSKRTRMTGMAKLSDANNAGGKKAKDCTLILTEGDSAKALAESGLGVVGRDNFGVFPLRGKLLNVRDAALDQIMKNAELQNIKKIMGLQHGKDYQNISSLRYGSLMIMTDQDHDGSHIKGLLINFFDHFYPSLLKIPSFLVEFVTPIVRATRGSQKRNFFTIPEYLEWNEKSNKDGKWSVKYYKGLGTSTNQDAKDYFSNMTTHMIPFAPLKTEDRPLIDMAFSKQKVEERKEWLRKFKPGTYIDHNVDEITYDDFINRELVLYSVADNVRSIPSVVDGLKPGQRKILFGCFKRKLKDQIKVAQLVGYISEKTAYHHGEQSLATSIIALAQDFVGSNNLNLLSPDGQYGTRFNGGKDAASPRYIFTHLPSITRSIFHVQDDPILQYLVDDGDPVEPEWYVPVVPTVLINGAEGIGTGWSTSVPSYNPYDIVANIRRLMRNEPQVPMVPWFRGFLGTVEKAPGDKDKFTVTGIINQINDTSVEITELPIRRWTENYKEFLESCIIGAVHVQKDKEKDDKDKDKNKKGAKLQERFIQDYKEHHAGRHVHFIINMSAEQMKKAVADGLSQFKLTASIATSNMVCFDPDGSIKKYNSPEEILEEFYAIRFQFYQKRKAHVVHELQTQADRLNNQARFVQMIIDKKLAVSGRKKADIVAELRVKGFRPFPRISKAKEAGETEDAQDDEQDSPGNIGDYDYLLGMAIWSLTQEKVNRLNKECAAKEEELEAFVKLTPHQLWDADLEEFLRQWQAVLDEDEKLERGAGSSTKGKKQATLKTRKSVGSGGPKKHKGSHGSDDSDSEYGAKASKAAGVKAQSASLTAKTRVMKPSRKKILPNDPVDNILKKDVPPEQIMDDANSGPEPPAILKATTKHRDIARDDSSDNELNLGSSKLTSRMKPKSPPKKILADSKSKSVAKPAAKRKNIVPEIGDNEDNEAEYIKPTKKTKVASSIEDFFDTIPSESNSKPRPKVKGSTAKPLKTRAPSDEEDSFMASDPSPPPKPSASRRPARAAASRKIIMPSEPEDDEDSDFQVLE